MNAIGELSGAIITLTAPRDCARRAATLIRPPCVTGPGVSERAMAMLLAGSSNAVRAVLRQQGWSTLTDLFGPMSRRSVRRRACSGLA